MSPPNLALTTNLIPGYREQAKPYMAWVDQCFYVHRCEVMAAGPDTGKSLRLFAIISHKVQPRPQTE